MIEKLKSRKLWAAIVGSMLTVVGRELFGLDDAVLTKLVAIVCTYIAGQGLVDTFGPEA